MGEHIDPNAKYRSFQEMSLYHFMTFLLLLAICKAILLQET